MSDDFRAPRFVAWGELLWDLFPDGPDGRSLPRMLPTMPRAGAPMRASSAASHCGRYSISNVARRVA